VDEWVAGIRIGLEVLGGIALVLAPFLAVARRAKIEIRPKDWYGAVPWRFATVDIRNAPPPRWLPLVAREAAIACRVSIQFFRGGEPVTPVIAGRWSDRAEPIRPEKVDPATGRVIGPFLPELIPPSQVYDLPAGGRWEEVAVAVLMGGEAYGWGAESYRFDWRHPDWRLDRGVYDVEVRVDWQGRSKARRFRLEYLSNDPQPFRLTAG